MKETTAIALAVTAVVVLARILESVIKAYLPRSGNGQRRFDSDNHASLRKLEEGQEKIKGILYNLADSQRRTVEALERMEQRYELRRNLREMTPAMGIRKYDPEDP